MKDTILEPRKRYLFELEREHLLNTEEYFDNLAKEAGVNIEENRKTCALLYSVRKEIEKLKKKIASKRGLMIFVIILAVILMFTGGIMAAIGGNSSQVLFIVLGLLLLFSALGGMIFFIIFSRKRIKMLQKLIDEKTKRADELLKVAYQQMAALNASYEWNTYNIIMEKTTPIIEMDRIFDMKKYVQLKNKFKLKDPNLNTSSTVLAQSGSIVGNPFIIVREHIQNMGMKTYTGSKTISWVSRVSNGKGGYTTVTRSQTLTATVSKPAPEYSYNTKLIFGSEAAPDLSFTRKPLKHGYDDKALEKFFKQREKEVDEYIKKHPNFTPLGNDKFEDFFGGLDRDNEVQYRLLFTPLAQLSMLDILTNKEPFGDDFSFIKQKMINTIRSSHAQRADYDGSTASFFHYDFDIARKNFIERNVEYFKNLFFDLAPILSIPLYQQYPTNEYIFKREKDEDYSRHLSEMEANRFDERVFKPSEAITPLILKSEFVRLNNDAHQVQMHAYSFKGVEHVEYVSKMGGDGRWHDVPVHWIEYVPIDKVTPFVVQPTELTRREFQVLENSQDYTQFINRNVYKNDILVSRGLFSFVNNTSVYDANELTKTIEKILKK